MQVITNMCGIFYNNFSLNYHQSNKILSLLKNRGPDKSNFIKIKNQNFIFTWLSTMNFGGYPIQPIHTKDKKLFFNGNIFNFKDLLNQFNLNPRKVKSDTELLFILLTKKPFKDVINLIQGQFSILFFNKNKIYLTRDCFGQKPLYYSNINNNLIISSLISCIRIAANIELIDQNYLKTYLLSGNNIYRGLKDNYSTIFKNVKSVKPGEIITIEDNKIIHRDNYNYESFYNSNNSEFYNSNNSLNKFEEIFDKSIKKININSLNETSSILFSGGLDSLLIYKHLRHAECFTKLTKNKEIVPLKVIKELQNKKNHHKFNFDNLTISKQYNWTKSISLKLEEPLLWPASSSLGPIYKLANHMNYRYLLSGIGADEMMFGYQHNLRDNLNNISPILEPDINIFKFHDYEEVKYNYINEIKKTIPTILSDKKDINEIHRAQELFYFVPQTTLSAEGFSSENSLDLRYPFLDFDLVKFILNIPKKKLLNKKNKFQNKIILKEAISKNFGKQFILPKEGTKNFASEISKKITSKFKNYIVCDYLKINNFDLLGVKSIYKLQNIEMILKKIFL